MLERGADAGAPWVPQPQDPNLMAQQMYAVAHAAQMATVLPPDANPDVPPVPVPVKHGEVSDAADMLLALSGTHQQDGTVVDPDGMEVKTQIPAPQGSPLDVPQDLVPSQQVVAPQTQIPPPVRPRRLSCRACHGCVVLRSLHLLLHARLCQYTTMMRCSWRTKPLMSRSCWNATL